MAYEEWSSTDKVEKYHRKRYKSFDQKIVDKLEKRIVRSIFNKYNITGPLLDIPCGYGRFHTLLNNFGEIHAADNGKLIAKYQKENVGLSKSTTICDAAKMPYENNSFDAVFSFRLIQHIHNSNERIAIYNEFNRVSKKWVIISLYKNVPLHTTFKKFSKKKAKITFLNSTTIESELAKANLIPVYSRYIIPGVHGHKIILTKKKI